MGTKTTVGTTVMRVLKDADLPGSIRNGVTKALLKEGDIVDYVLEELVSGLGMKAQRMYDYAKSGAYTHGLPSGQFTTGVDGLDQVSAALASIEGAPVTIDYSHYGAPNNLHIGWLRLIDTHGYNPATNQLAVLSAAKGAPVYLEDMVVVVPAADIAKLEPSTLALWGFAARAGYTPERSQLTDAARKLIKPSPLVTLSDGTSEFLRVTYGWMAGGHYTKDTFTIPVAGYDNLGDYFHVRYSVGGVTKYWIYKDGDGTFPDLDAVFDREQEPNGSFFPFMYFRYQKHSDNADKSTPAYKTSKKLASYIGFDYDQVADGVNANPDIENVEQAMMMFAVPANTTNPLEQRYLYEFFSNLFNASAPGTKYSSQTAAEIANQYEDHFGYAVSTTPLTPGIIIQDARFKMSLENDGIYKRRVAGSIGPVGSYDSNFEVLTRPITVTTMTDTGNDVIIGTGTVDVSTSSHYYRRQVSTGFYDEVQVVGMKTRFHIIDGYSTLGDEQDEILIIPLDHSITKRFSIPERESLYARSMHYVFNSVVVQHIKWYQTGLFQVILVIVAIIIFIYTGADIYTPIYAALVAGNYAAAAILIGTLVLETIVVQYAFKLFVKAVGVEAALAIAIIAVAAGVVMSVDAGSLSGAPWASDLLKLSTGISKAIGGQLQLDYQDLLGDANDFGLFVEAQTKLLDDAKALLENKNHLDPFVIFGESPQEYYNRTVHSGNIGIVGIDAVSTYVDMALRLPKLNDTLGEAI